MRITSLTMLAGLVVFLIAMMNLTLSLQPAPLATPFDIASAPAADSAKTGARVAVLARERPLTAPEMMDDGPAAPQGWPPERLVIPSLGVDAPIQPVEVKQIEYEGTTYEQWLTPKQAVGWHGTSALIGLSGNTVFNAHHNSGAKIFKDLVNLRAGDEIIVYANGRPFTYIVDITMLLSEKYRPLTDRIEHARWAQTTADERITLITCWPPESNTHRVIVVAYPKK